MSKAMTTRPHSELTADAYSIRPRNRTGGYPSTRHPRHSGGTPIDLRFCAYSAAYLLSADPTDDLQPRAAADYEGRPRSRPDFVAGSRASTHSYPIR